MLLSVSVVGRYVFYGNSVFDHGGNRASAIAPDKQPLMPGQTASFANYTSYVKGINGIAMDLAGWDGKPIPMLFRVGTSPDTSTWTGTVQPTKWEQYPGQGVGGSTRLVMVFPDYWVRNEWVQVTLGGPGTEMPTPDVFYFGNEVGASGNSPLNPAVTSADQIFTRNDPHSFRNPATITNPHDYNRDGRVDAIDQTIVRNNLAPAGQSIPLLGTSSGPDIRWDYNSFLSAVKPMQHSLGTFRPMNYWSLTLPAQDLTTMLSDGSLQTAVQNYLARGFVPQVYAGDPTALSQQIALAKAIQSAGAPVVVSVPTTNLLESTVFQNNTVWASGPDATQGGAVRQWPCLPLANGALGASYVTSILAPFKAAGVNVSRVQFDDESLPYPWNGVWDAERASAASRAYYPAGVLDTWNAFETYVLNLRTQLEQQVMVAPVHALWPNAYVGNFNESDSSTAVPYYMSNATQIPPRALGANTISMPGAYAAPYELSGYTQTYTQANADNYYFSYLLRTITSSLANRQPGNLDIPYLSQFDNAGATMPASQQFGLSTARFQELLRQMWLRGANSVMLFTYNPSAVQSFPQVQAASSVLDEMLGYGAFLTSGQPMNLGLPVVGTPGPVWSGMKLGNQCLIRTFTDAATAGTVTVTAFPGVTVTLPAPTTGATFIVNSNGTFQRVDAQPAAAAASSLAPVATRSTTAAVQPADTAATTTASSQFWQDDENRKQTLVARARRPAATFSNTAIKG